ncbi:MAG: hypothetical protein K0S18_156 [Anaerocolumna sp.]|jgi:hypothetical protein|nr:hypothetical protein [Anaerocolumna sp.]
MKKLYYSIINLHLSGREYEIIKTYKDGSKLIKFPTFGGQTIKAYQDELDESQKTACENKLQEEQEKIINHKWH